MKTSKQEYFVVNGDVYLYENIISGSCALDKNGNPVYYLRMKRPHDGRRFDLTVKGTNAYAFDKHRAGVAIG